MRINLTLLIALWFFCLTAKADDSLGTLIFKDDFERSESQELKDEPGNEWTTSSETTAKGNKQVDLRDGYLHIYTHPEANHATSVRHAFSFKDGTIAMKVRFESLDDSIKLNFTDLKEKSVHAGHLFNATFSPKKVILTDLKTGIMNHNFRNAKKAGKLTDVQKSQLRNKDREFKIDLAVDQWHDVRVTVSSDWVVCYVNKVNVGHFSSQGFAHPTKTLIRLLVAKKIDVDEIRIYRAKGETENAGIEARNINHARHLLLGCRTYAADFQGLFPKSLSDLFPNYIKAKNILSYTSADGVEKQFNYVKGLTDSDQSTSPLIYSEPDSTGKMVVGFVAGNIDYVKLKIKGQ